MTTALGRFSRLTHLRRAAVALRAIESVAVLIEKTTERDPLPGDTTYKARKTWLGNGTRGRGAPVVGAADDAVTSAC